MKRSSFRAIFAISFIVLALAAWIGYLSYTQTETRRIEAKVQNAISAGVENLAPQWPRIEMHNSLASGAYYSPIVSDSARSFELTRHVLEMLNQDESVPPVKLSTINLHIDFGPDQDTLVCQTRIEFPLFAGIEKKVDISSSFPIPHYNVLH